MIEIESGHWYRNRYDEKIYIVKDRDSRFIYPFKDQHGRRYTKTGLCEQLSDVRLGIKSEITDQLEMS